MVCRLCAWICDRICPPELNSNSIWDASNQWEETYSRDWEPWDEDDDRRTRSNEAVELVPNDPEKALAQLVELADEGSAFAMRWVGTLYLGRRGIEKDLGLAEEYFRLAVGAGSWMSTLSYANLLHDRGAHGECRETLADGVDRGFIPAFFWQAWNTYRLKPSREMAKAVRPLLLKAVEAGHPGAYVMLARWTTRGRFGLRRIPEGIRMLVTSYRNFTAALD